MAVMDQLRWKDIIQGDRQAYSEMYTTFYRSFFNYGRKFTEDSDLIEDAIQEVLMVAWTDRLKLEQIHSPRAYLFTAFRHALFARLRRLSHFTANLPDEPDFPADHLILKKETDLLRHEQLQAALRQLTSRQREAIFLRFYEGLSYEQTAEVMGISVKATYKLMARSLLQLRDILAISLTTLLAILRTRTGA